MSSHDHTGHTIHRQHIHHGWNNAFASIAVPIGLSERFTLTPSVGGSLALEGIRDAGEDDYCLAAIGLSFAF